MEWKKSDANVFLISRLGELIRRRKFSSSRFAPGNGRTPPLLVAAPGLLEAIRFYNDQGKWWVHLAVVMPDHVHLLARFPEDRKFTATVQNWKHWTAQHLKIQWQRDFFDHRLRQEESLKEKSDYILQNPVRARLVDDWRQWPHVWIAEGFVAR